MTLVFIGATSPGAVPQIATAIREVAARHRPIRVRLGGAGSFGGGSRPRVAWVGLAEGAESLRRLAEELHPRVLPQFAGTPRALSPHITVARRAADDLVLRMDRVLAEAPPVTWTADRIVHYRSHLAIGPPLHEQLSETILGRPAATDR